MVDDRATYMLNKVLTIAFGLYTLRKDTSQISALESRLFHPQKPEKN